MTTVRTVTSSTRRLTLGVLAATGRAAALMAPAARIRRRMSSCSASSALTERL